MQDYTSKMDTNHHFPERNGIYPIHENFGDNRLLLLMFGLRTIKKKTRKCNSPNKVNYDPANGFLDSFDTRSWSNTIEPE
jgi:hypothetical protein